MPVLPIIDLLIFSAWSVLSVGAVLKIVYVTTHYRPALFGLGPLECLMVSGILLLLSLSLSARSWVKAQEASTQHLSPRASPRAQSTLEAYAAATRATASDTDLGEGDHGKAAADGSSGERAVAG